MTTASLSVGNHVITAVYSGDDTFGGATSAPFTQGVGKPGRDHHQHAFTVFLAGAGLKPGFAYGSSDEIGYKVAENEVTIYDFHATLLHLLGIDHLQLTYYHNGIQRRLTDVHGEIVGEILA